jgi:hypothetical protein
MTKRISSSSLAKSIVSGLWIVVFLLSVMHQAQAKSSPTLNIGSDKRTIVLLISDPTASGTTTTAAFKANLVRLITRNAKIDPKSIKVLSKGCGCASATPDSLELSGFRSCMKGCLADVGIGPYALIMCGATCYFGAIPLCAICLGVSVAVVEICTLGCAGYPQGFHGTGTAKRQNLRPRHSAAGSPPVRGAISQTGY